MICPRGKQKNISTTKILRLLHAEVVDGRLAISTLQLMCINALYDCAVIFIFWKNPLFRMMMLMSNNSYSFIFFCGSCFSCNRIKPERILHSTRVATQRRFELLVVDLGSNVSTILFNRTRFLPSTAIGRLPVWSRSQMETWYICARLRPYVSSFQLTQRFHYIHPPLG